MKKRIYHELILCIYPFSFITNQVCFLVPISLYNCGEDDLGWLYELVCTLLLLEE